MWNIALTWLANNYPIVIIVLIVAVIAWIVAKFYYTRFKRTEDKVKALPCENYKHKIEDFANVRSKVDSLPCDTHSDLFHQISEDLVQIKTFLMIKNPSAATAFSIKKSPRKLNDAGEQLLADIRGMSFLDENKKFLLKSIDKKTPKTALDVETSANEVLFENLQNSIFNGLKNWVYNSPMRKVFINGDEKDYAVTIGDVCFILSIPLRDMYLKEHPEISVE